MFIKLFYGFGVPELPLITFGQPQAAQKLIRDAAPGDFLLFAATKNRKTRNPNERGRLLGAAQFGSEIVPVETLVDASLLRAEFMENGQYRWPEAIPMLQAWRFELAPFTSEVILDRVIARNASNYALKLSNADRERVEALKWVEVPLPSTQEHVRQREEMERRLAGRSRPGPIARPGEYIANRAPKPEAWTYAARFGDTPIWKIGHATDLRNRIAQLNAHVPVEWLQQEWKIFFLEGWKSQEHALNMEQAVLDALAQCPIERERVRCSPEILRSAWLRVLSALRNAS
jgi:hypothetical protein